MTKCPKCESTNTELKDTVSMVRGLKALRETK